MFYTGRAKKPGFTICGYHSNSAGRENVADNYLIRLDGSVFHVAVETNSRHPNDMNKKTSIRSNPQSLDQTVSRNNRCYLPLESTWQQPLDCE